LTVLAWPKKNNNPYIEILYREFEKQGCKVLSHRENRIKNLFSENVDIFHFHWLNSYLMHNTLKSLIATIAFISYIKILKSKNVKIVWTVHNSETFTHHGKNKWLEKILVPFLLENSDKLIIHNKNQKNHFDKKYYNKIVYIPHHNYLPILNSQVRSFKLKAKYFLFFGGISPYKGIEKLITMYNDIEINIPLKIVGRINGEGYKEKLEKLITNKEKIILEDRFLSDEELELLIKESKAIILPFSKITNSGSLILSLSCRKPVIITRNLLSQKIVEEYPNLKNVIHIYSRDDELENVLLNIDKKGYFDSDFNSYLETTNVDNLVKEKYFKEFNNLINK